MTSEITVVKCGGSPLIDRAALCADIAGLTRAGGRVVLVHGGAAEVDGLAAQLGVPQRRLTTPGGTSSRYTDPATLDVLMMALAGRIKPELVGALAAGGVRAVGLTGLDGSLITARRPAAHRAVVDGRKVVVRDDRSGRIEHVDAGLLRILLAHDMVPVVSPPALGLDGLAVNVDADRAAAAIAVALGATRLVLLTGAPGVLTDPADETSLLSELALAADGTSGVPGVGGGMTVKLAAAHAALTGGVREVRIADGRSAAPLTGALAGKGTAVVENQLVEIR
ncbi:[LysW]-aminoadipate kinase [Winogradskya consettensis]|uniref:Acetylglutamate kinase n=1 Tax=Winogradskya consettensis TaxID=113560 RepID=A0A919SAD4_9ACTN|nr:[LysW]-aminoadipate kinase [Actinoplanes consettensis]GIM67805.1 acetylglutamate kinase [Actinoplanes consettensis]